MGDSGLALSLRNIFLAHLLVLTAAPEQYLRMRRGLVKLWKTLKAPLFPAQARPQKKSSFQEIDMTRFEP